MAINIGERKKSFSSDIIMSGTWPFVHITRHG